MVLRLDPALPLVWRSPTAVQFGIDEAVAVVDPIGPGHEQLISALEAGVSRSGYDMLARRAGIAAPDAEALLLALGPALAVPVPDPAPRTAVLGDTALAAALRALLGERLDPDPETAVLVVLTADWVLPPGDHGTWLNRDRAHVPVITGDRAVTIGPFVEPGRGPCLYCVHLARVDADPAYPAIVAQLWQRAAPHRSRLAIDEAAAFAVRRIEEWRPAADPQSAVGDTASALEPASAPAPGGPDAATTLSWRIDSATGHVTPTAWRRHPECRCAVPPESDWAPDPDPATPDATTTARADAAPA